MIEQMTGLLMKLDQSKSFPGIFLLELEEKALL